MSIKPEQSGQGSTAWIHCSKCFENYINKQRNIYILSCYDVVCENCIEMISERGGKCPICGKAVKGHPIGNNLSPNLKELFHPKPWLLNFQKSWAVVKFQTKQRDHFLAGWQKVNEFNKSLEQERDRIKEDGKQTYLRQITVRKERTQLEKILKKFMEKKYEYQCLDKSRHSEVEFEKQRGAFQRDDDYAFPPTFHAQRRESTFDLPLDNDNSSKSFYL